MYSVFSKLKKNLIFVLEIIIFVDNFSKFSKIFKVLKIRDSSLIETLILNLLLKTNRFYLLNCLRDSVSRKPLFLPKTGKA